MKLKEPKIVIHHIGSFVEIAYKDINKAGIICRDLISLFQKLKVVLEENKQYLPEWYIPYCTQTLSLLLAIKGDESDMRPEQLINHQLLLLLLHEISAIHEELDNHSDHNIEAAVSEIRWFASNSIELYVATE